MADSRQGTDEYEPLTLAELTWPAGPGAGFPVSEAPAPAAVLLAGDERRPVPFHALFSSGDPLTAAAAAACAPTGPPCAPHSPPSEGRLNVGTLVVLVVGWGTKIWSI